MFPAGWLSGLLQVAVFLLTSLTEYAELVSFGISHDNPRLIPLADIHAPCAMCQQASYLGLLVIRPEVEMQSTLGLLGLVVPYKVQAWKPILSRANLELLVRGVDDDPSERLRPLSQRGRVY